MYKQFVELQIQANSHSDIWLPATYAYHPEEKYSQYKPISFPFAAITLLEWATKADETGNETPFVIIGIAISSSFRENAVNIAELQCRREQNRFQLE